MSHGIDREVFVGFPEYVWVLLTDRAATINTAAIKIAYTTSATVPAPGSATWYTPDAYSTVDKDGNPLTTKQRRGGLLIGSPTHALTAGVYHLWGRLPDTPEDLPVWAGRFRVRA